MHFSIFQERAMRQCGQVAKYEEVEPFYVCKKQQL